MRMRNEVGNFSLIDSPCHWFQTLDSIGIQARVFNSRCIKDLQQSRIVVSHDQIVTGTNTRH